MPADNPAWLELRSSLRPKIVITGINWHRLRYYDYGDANSFQRVTFGLGLARLEFFAPKSTERFRAH